MTITTAILLTLRDRAAAIEAYPGLAIEHALCAASELMAFVAEARRRSTRYTVIVERADGFDHIPAYGIGAAMRLVSDYHDEMGCPVVVTCEGIEVYAA